MKIWLDIAGEKSEKRCLQIFVEALAQYLPPPVASGLNERDVEGWNRKWTKLVFFFKWEISS